MTHTLDDNACNTRQELLKILTSGIATAIADAPYDAAKLAEGVIATLDILAPIKQNRVGFKRNAEGTLDPYLDENIPTIVGGVEQTAPRVTIEQI
jgi:hypothetical protein